MQQKKVRSIPLVIVLATKIIGALNQFAASIGLLLVSKAGFETAVNELIAARDAHESAKVDLAQKRAALKVLIGSAQEFITSAREVMKRTFGKKYSQAWDIAGFRSNLQVPRTADKLQAMVQSWKTFLTNNAAMEIAPLNLTATYAGTLLEDITEAQTAINLQESTVNSLLMARDLKAKALQVLISTLLSELTLKLTPLDPAWLAFGFNKPGAKAIPDVPTGLMALLVGPDAISVKWTAAARAEYYRIWVKVNGVHTELDVIASSSDLDFTIPGLSPNTTVEIAITAMNNGGESAKSEVLVVQTTA